MNLTDCYRVLGLPPHATLTQVKQNYRRLARQYHPDSQQQSQAQDYFILIHEAYQTLRQVLPPEKKVSSPVRSAAATQSPIRIEVKHPDAPRRTPHPPATQSPPEPPKKPPIPVTQTSTCPPDKPPARPVPTPSDQKIPTTAASPGQVPKKQPPKPYSPVNPQPFPIAAPAPKVAPALKVVTTAPAPPPSSKVPTLPNIPQPASKISHRLVLSPFEQQLKKRSYQQLQELLRYRRFERAVVLTEGLRQALPTDPEVKQWQGITYHCWARELIKKGQSAQACYCLHQAQQADPHNEALAAAINQDFNQLERRFPKRQLVAI